jgi:GNAT superfamily N-acetyltransferase
MTRVGEIEVRVATAGGHAPLAAMFGRAFVSEPMMYWPMGSGGDLAGRFAAAFDHFLAAVLPAGIVHEVPAARGAAVWVPPGLEEDWDVHPWNQPAIAALTDDGGRRYDAFWDWVYAHTPREPLWQLDSIAVEPAAQGSGLGSALIAAGLEAAAADRLPAFLSTGTERNVAIYGRSGFRVVEEAEAPGGGPHVWFMRWDPA